MNGDFSVDIGNLTEALEAHGIIRKVHQWDRWVEEIPWMHWPSGWEVKAVPPFSGAVVRYLVRDCDTPKGQRVSVYLDCYSVLGVNQNGPYWEAYPGAEDGDIDRCDMEDLAGLKAIIGAGLEFLYENK